MAVTDHEPAFGELLRAWRTRRRRSQLELAIGAEVSARHLSFLETGRARPSREMILHLAEHLDVPLRARNELLVAAGFAPVYRERALDEPQMGVVRDALQVVLTAHEPYPAVVVDRGWNLVATNAAATVFIEGISPFLLQRPVNVVRLSMHPEGLAGRVVNFDQYAAHMIDRLRRQVELTGDPVLADLLDEARRYAGPVTAAPAPGSAVVLPLRIRTASGEELSLFSTIAVMGTPVEITVSELAVESFFPADAASATVLQQRALAPQSG